MRDWIVYIVECADGSFYTGITNDLSRRLLEHNRDNKRAARYTRSRRPVTVVYRENHPNRSGAGKREAIIKKLTRHRKQRLIRQYCIANTTK